MKLEIELIIDAERPHQTGGAFLHIWATFSPVLLIVSWHFLLHLVDFFSSLALRQGFSVIYHHLLLARPKRDRIQKHLRGLLHIEVFLVPFEFVLLMLAYHTLLNSLFLLD